MDFKHKILLRWLEIRRRYIRFHSRFLHIFELFSKIFGGAALLAAILCIVALTLMAGFDHRSGDAVMLFRLVRTAQWIFIVKVLYNLIFCYRSAKRDIRVFRLIATIFLLLTLPALIYPHPEHPWIPFLEKLLYDKRIICTIVGLYAVIELCYGIMRMLNRRVNPTVILAVSFLFLIITGSFVLMMPRCTVGGISYVDSLFISTSAVCITGLCPIDVATQLTPLGILVLSILIQIGGLGVMTFTSFFALFFSGNTSVYSQIAVKDMIYSKTIGSLSSTLIYILGFTLVIEAIGAVAIFISVHGIIGMPTEDELIFSAFHSLSAFCNAGFSNVEGGLSIPALIHSNQSIYIIASALIFAGGIGFPILVNLKSAFTAKVKRFFSHVLNRRKPSDCNVHILDMNTKIVLSTTTAIFAVSALLFFIFEYDNSLAGMSLYDKIVQSVFNSFVPRSSGFSSVNPAGFLNITIMMMIVLMWIGGASQSTAGGIKVNTLAVIFLELKAVVTGRSRVVAYHRTIATDSLRRANAIVAVSIASYILYSMTLIALEPTLPVKSLLFESASALFTVGSSLGITPMLSDPSKILICTAMFFGRVGILSLLSGLVRQHRDNAVRYPIDNVIIN